MWENTGLRAGSKKEDFINGGISTFVINFYLLYREYCVLNSIGIEKVQSGGNIQRHFKKYKLKFTCLMIMVYFVRLD